MTPDFWRICVVSGLSQMALFMMLALLPFALSGQWGIPATEIAPLYILFIIGMLLVSPFHAWLADAFKRKYVLMLPLLLLAALPFGILYATQYLQLLALMLGAGVCYGLTLSVGITISIDIIESERRSSANVVYAYATFSGVLLGLLAVWLLLPLVGFQTLCYVASGVLVLAFLLSSVIYVAFRAPIGLACCSIDRFFLPRTWPLAVNMLLLGCVPGFLLMLISSDQAYFPIAAMLLILLPLKHAVIAFIRLSEHCQRATAVHSCFFFTLVGILLGASLSAMLGNADGSKTLSLLALLAAAVCLPFSIRYCKNHIVRK